MKFNLRGSSAYQFLFKRRKVKQHMSPFQKVARMTLLTINLGVALSITGIPQPTQRITGDMWISGDVSLNNVPATSGVTVFNNSQIKTTRNSSATVNLGKLGRVKLEPESEVRLQFSSDLIEGVQGLGLMAVSANKGIKAKVMTPHVLVESNGAELGLISVEVNREYTCVVVNRGTATLTSNRKITQLKQGDALSFDTNGPEKVSHCEGLKSASNFKPLLVTGAVTAAALLPLTRESISTVRGVSTIPVGPNEVSNQSATPPQVNASKNPTTPIKPPVAFLQCGCKFDKDGKALDPGQQVSFCHVAGNGNRNLITTSCAGLTGHFNLNGTPRAGHLNDKCFTCSPD
jgi:hypothetical protein